MRICLVTHGFPPVERTGVENYTLGLARAMGRAGHRVEVFVPRRDLQLADYSLRREERDGFAVNWITSNRDPSGPREMLLLPEIRKAFAAFLDRERPQVVHFQHLIKLGIELVEVTRERGIPTVYTAHDYYALCHRYTLLRPDLTHCEVRGDAAACARCDLALGLLNSEQGLGDYQIGVLPGQLNQGVRRRLAALLAGDPVAAGFAPEEMARALEVRAELDSMRQHAYRGLDLILAPSQYLARELTRGGLEERRIRVLPYGLESSDLSAVPRLRPEPARPLRFGYLGGLSKHKGVHVLLEAFGQLKGRAELSIWGASSDRPYVESLRQRSSEVGAQWRGAYERPQLPGLLAEVDVVVVPSIWVENQPLVIREAFAAGRPVLASRMGALSESVQDGRDGLLFEPGDARDLARLMRRCIEESELVPQLASGIVPGPGVAPHARELVGLYQELIDARPPGADPASGKLPASLRAAVERHRELSSLPARELLSNVISGLGQLRAAWDEPLGGSGPMELLAQGLEVGSEAQDRLREARAEIAWLRTKKGELDEGREELMEVFENLDQLLNETRAGAEQRDRHLLSAGAYVQEKEAEVSAAHARLRDLEQVLEAKNAYLRRIEDELNEAGAYIRRKEAEHVQSESRARGAEHAVREREQQLEAARQELAHRQQELAAARAAVAETEAGREEAERALRASELGLASAEEELRARSEGLEEARRVLLETEEGLESSRSDLRVTAELGLTAIEAQERLLAGSLRPILARLHDMLAPGTTAQLPAEGAHFHELLEALRQGLHGMRTLERELAWLREQQPELEWRRQQMARVHARVVRGPLGWLLRRTRGGRRIAGWQSADGQPWNDGGGGS